MQGVLVGNNKSCLDQGTFIAVKNEGHTIIRFREVCKTFKEIYHFHMTHRYPLKDSDILSSIQFGI